MMQKSSHFTQYGLYGEGNSAISPEFFHIEPISARSSRYEWSIAPHTHPGIFQLLLLEKGAGELAADGHVIKLSPTSLVAIPSGAIHAFDFDTDAEGWVLSVAIELLDQLRLARRQNRHSLQAGPATAVSLVPDARIRWLFKEIAADFADEYLAEVPEPTLALLTALLVSAEAALTSAPRTIANASTGAARKERLVQRFRKLIEEHYREDWPVTRYAEALGASPSTLTRACRDTVKIAPGDMVLDRKLLEAMRALTYTASSIGHISEDLGFQDPAYFARFFKTRTGFTARQFREEQIWLNRLKADPRSDS
jgi:AraC family transcriptional regulator, transcriptional activator of pobA